MMLTLNHVAFIALSVFLSTAKAEDIVVLEAPQNAIAIQGTAVNLTLVTNKPHQCDIFVSLNISRSDDHVKIFEDRQKMRYDDESDQFKLIDNEGRNHSTILKVQSEKPVARLFTFSLEVGSQPYGAYVAFLESEPTCSSSRDTEDEHQSGNGTILTCSLIASSDIGPALQLLWNSSNGSPLEKSFSRNFYGQSADGSKYDILTSQIELVATVHGTDSVTCSVLFNVTRFGQLDKNMAKNSVLLSNTCSTKYFPLRDIEKSTTDKDSNFNKFVKSILITIVSIVAVSVFINAVQFLMALYHSYHTKEGKALWKRIGRFCTTLCTKKQRTVKKEYPAPTDDDVSKLDDVEGKAEGQVLVQEEQEEPVNLAFNSVRPEPDDDVASHLSIEEESGL